MKVFHLFLVALFLYNPIIVRANDKTDDVPAAHNEPQIEKFKIAAALGSISVAIADDNEKTSRLDFRAAEVELFHNNEERAKKDIPENWQQELQESIKNMAVFQDDATASVTLAVTILKLEVNLLI